MYLEIVVFFHTTYKSMILESLKYIREEGKPNEWGIEGKNGDLIRFDNINLFVGGE